MLDRLPVRPVRMGNVATHYRFPFKCSQCPTEFEFESRSKMPDGQVLIKMGRMGWLMGKKRSADLCPKCVGVKPANQLASHFKVISNEGPVTSAEDMVKTLGEERANQTKDLLDKFAPNEPKPSKKAEPRVEQHIVQQNVDIAPIVEELKANRVALELLFDQNAKLVQLSEQMIQAFGRFVPLANRGNENIVYHLQKVCDAIKDIPAPVVQTIAPVEPEPAPEPDQTTIIPYRKPRPNTRYAKPIDVRSTIPRKMEHFRGKDMRLTTIAISDEVIAKAGFNRDMQFTITKKSGVIIIEKTKDQYGLKARTSSAEGMSISTYKLGDCSDYNKVTYTVKKGQIEIRKKRVK